MGAERHLIARRAVSLLGTLPRVTNVDSYPFSFCVWTSMLKRSIQTAQFFDEDDYDTKQFKMLDELNAGTMEGLTYEEIRTKHSEEFRLRQRDKLHYRCGYIPCGLPLFGIIPFL